METFICFLIGVLGVVGHCLMKANSLMKDAKVANISFSFREYIKADYLGIGLSFIAVVVWVLIFKEVSFKYPAIENYIRLSFFLVGIMGSYLIQTLTSFSKKRIRNIIDKKTDIADDKY